jgi:glucokinase
MSTIIGVDVGGTLLRAARFDTEFNILERRERSTHAERGREVVLERLIDLIEEVMPEERGDLLGIGITAPGPLDAQQGVVIAPPNLPWDNMPLVERIEQALGVRVWLGNDADLAGLAEHRLGAGRGYHNMVYMTISTGIGGGIIINDDLLTGCGLAGEVGHMPMVPDGPLCGCGHPGHLEAVASGTGIARIARERLASGEESAILGLVNGDLGAVDARIVGQAAQKGDKLALEIVQRAGFYIGMVIASLMHVLNPEIFVLGGGLTNMGDMLFDPIRESVRLHAMHPRYWENTPIVLAELGQDVGLKGTAVLALLRHSQQMADG